MVWASETQGNQVAAANTPLPKRYRAKLDSVGAVAQEIRRLYREARSGVLPVEQASKLANMLALIARIIETSDLEARLEKLEAGA